MEHTLVTSKVEKQYWACYEVPETRQMFGTQMMAQAVLPSKFGLHKSEKKSHPNTLDS